MMSNRFHQPHFEFSALFMKSFLKNDKKTDFLNSVSIALQKYEKRIHRIDEKRSMKNLIHEMRKILKCTPFHLQPSIYFCALFEK